jgi:thiol:disulfide interchange protein/DsbC/DsbD-like thiol-disulfide interchange protein
MSFKPALVLPLLGLFATGAPAGAVEPQEPSRHVAAELVSERVALVPGQPAQVGLRLAHEPHWHTYWIVPGDAGLPTRLTWRVHFIVGQRAQDVPQGFRVGPIQWPVPQLLRVGSLANYGYEGTVLLPVTINVPGAVKEGSTVQLAAHADWLVCSDICIPESADLTLALPVSKAADATPSRFQGEFAAASARIPRPMTLTGADAVIEGERIRLRYRTDAKPHRLEFFPLEPMRIQAAAPQRLGFPASAEGSHASGVPGLEVSLDLLAQQPVAPDFNVLRGVLVGDGGPGQQSRDGWAGVIEVPLRAGVVPAFAVGAAPTAESAAIGAATPASAASDPIHTAAPMSLLLALAGAFLGGLILNLMPCVFPVLSLKLLALVQHRQRADPSLAAHGSAYTAGVVVSFVVLAAALVGLRAGGSQLGWGFQLQSPLFVAVLTALFFGIGLNLLGAFEVSFGTKLLNSTAVQSFDDHHLRGSFATGVLAVLVASPCTAPFMGAALGYAVSQPAPAALSVFAMLGAGMAAPYLALTLSPALLKRLPRPGAWMQRLRQLLAFPMFLTCVWLMWVLQQQIDVGAFALVLAGLVVLGLAAWSAGQAQQGSRAFRWVGMVAALAAAIALVAATGQRSVPLARASTLGTESGNWTEWSPRAQSLSLSQGHPVFVDFTAAWCVTCQANQRLVLNSDRVAAAFTERKVTLLKADWTNRNDTIAKELARFGRNGVPLYVLYDGAGRPHLLPEILTERVVLDALSGL